MSQSPDLEYWLPHELWELIAAKYLKDPHDLYNLSDASPYFFQLLQRKRSQFLLQLVLPILGNPAGFLQPYLRRNDMLNFRLANRRCNQSVEYYFQRHLFQKESFISEVDLPLVVFNFSYYTQYILRSDYFPSALPGIDRRVGAAINRSNYNTVEDWLNTIQVTHPPETNANPVLSRGAHFTLKKSYDEDNMILQGIISAVTRYMQLYGRHFNRCTFEFGAGIAMELKYDYLRGWLSLAPNLNFLQVDFSKSSNPAETTRNLTDWNSYIASNPMPALRHLMVLETKNVPHPIQNAFFQRYGHVETLHLSFDGREAEKFGPVQLENLKTLKVEVSSPSELIALERCLSPSWLQLQTLEMEFSPITDSASQNERDYCSGWAQIISFLNEHFSQASRLVQLFLGFGKSNFTNDVLRDTQTCRLRLRHIEQLKLSVENQFLLDFLLPMKSSLKKLAILDLRNGRTGIQLPPNNEVDFEEKIAWNGRLGRVLLESNIWTTFRKLNYLRVEMEEGWTYRRMMGTPIYINPKGREESVQIFDEDVSDNEN